MSLASRIASLLTALTSNQVSAMSPVARQRLADECQRVQNLVAIADTKPPKSGVLARLSDGERAQ